MSDTIKTDYATLLNALRDMERNPVYSLRRQELAEAQSVILELEAKAKATAAPAITSDFKLLTEQELVALQSRLINAGTYDFVNYAAEVERMTVERLAGKPAQAGLDALRDAALEEAAQYMDKKAAKWEKEAQRHLPHHNSEYARRDKERAEECRTHARMIREHKGKPRKVA